MPSTARRKPGAYRIRPGQGLHRRIIAVLATMRAMGTNTRRRLFGFDAERLGDYAGGHRHKLIAGCPCGHTRALRLELLLKAFGPDARLGMLRQHLRCHSCNRRGLKLRAVLNVGRPSSRLCHCDQIDSLAEAAAQCMCSGRLRCDDPTLKHP